MESTINIEVNVVTNMFRVVDSTDYAAQGVSLAALAAKGLGTVRFNGDIVYQKLLVGDPLVNLAAGATTSAWVACPLDSNGNAAYGTYTCDYSVRTMLDDLTCDSVVSGSGGTGAFILDGLDLTNVLAAGDSITISNSLSLNNGVRTITSVTLASGNSSLFVSQTVNTETPVASSKLSFDITKVTGDASAVYAGCTQVTPTFSFTSECDYGLFGRLSVLDTTNANGQTVISRLLTLMYPSWTDTANVTSDEGGIVLGALATGTWTVSNVYEFSQTTGDLIVTYTASVEEERRVTCSGSLCGLLPCIQNLLQVHSASVKTGFSPYQYYVDAITLNYIQALEYRKCGNYDEYQAKVAAIDALLDESGCECSCCDDDVLIWVTNASAGDVTVLEELQDQIDALDIRVTANEDNISELAGITTQLGVDLSLVEADVETIFTLLPLGYLATASQSGTSAPVMTIGYNQTALAFTAARTGIGNYTLTSSTPFDPTKVVVAQVATTNILKRVTAYVESSTVIRIQTFDNTTYALEDTVLLDSKIHIQVYP